MGDTRQVVDGEDASRVRPLRPAAPPEEPGGPPAPIRLPRPRRPWLRSTAPDEPAPRTPEPTEPASAEPTEPAEPASAEPTTAEPTTGDRAGTDPATGPGSAAAADTDTPSPADDATKTAAGQTDATKTEATKTDATKTDAGQDGEGAKDGESAKDGAGRAGAARRRRVPFAHAVRMPPPRQAAVAAARATRAWSRRPSGRLALPGLFLLALVGATAAAGALVVPATAPQPRPAAVDATSAPPEVSAAPSGGVLPGGSAAPLPPGTTPFPGTTGLPAATPGPGGQVPAGRPADALATWAQQIGAKAQIAPVAMQAYGYAELVLAQTTPGCRLSWTTLAAIGYVESRHGQANDTSLGADGRTLKEIIGDPLDGNGGRQRIMDTDRGLYDRDTVYDRAIGPMQFIPTTWQEIGADADGDGRRDPHDIDDAALAAGNYLCKGGRNLTVSGDWWGAILSYNDVRRYAQDVFDRANEYGLASRKP
ncbi:lytic murein transglycosylase [Micromonospora sp. DT233]|uniref:lytic transglycosylase domain-containing protein n=1 Tax=Micromonospora sp. DT233 TaxID=3393432 RepID=UPI003CEABE66